MAKLLPIILIVVGLVGGIVGGMALKPSPPECPDPEKHAGLLGPAQIPPSEIPGETPITDIRDIAADGDAASDGDKAGAGEGCPDEKVEEDPVPELEPSEFADLERQFVVPLVNDERVTALVVASISIEVPVGEIDAVFGVEPKLRDAFLKVMFTHAHSGGFNGAFTSSSAMSDLKGRLKEVAKEILGKTLKDVLITEIVRQDM